MIDAVPSDHDATGSLLGYLAQCRYALLMALDELKKHPSHDVSIERFDDVAFEINGTPQELIQTKHHGTPCNVTDMSVDIWKTLLIWIKQIQGNPQVAAETRFVFMTTAQAAEGSAFALLRGGDANRDVTTATSKLVAAAGKSTNQVSANGREAFLAMGSALRKLFMSNVIVFDNAPNIIDVREEVEGALMIGVPAEVLSDYTDRVEGWWFRRVIAGLSKTDSPAISLTSLSAKLAEIRDDFRVSGLPLHPDIEKVDVIGLSDDDERVFVRQMRLVGLPDGPANRAVHDYYRAFVQRSKWARQDLLLDDEAESYDGSLSDAFAREVDAAKDVHPCGSEDERCTLGRMLFHWSTRHQQPLRNRHELWLSSGSYQMLADRKSIGWHLDFEALLKNNEQKS